MSVGGLWGAAFLAIVITASSLSCDLPIECDARSPGFERCEAAKQFYRQSQAQALRVMEDGTRHGSPGVTASPASRPQLQPTAAALDQARVAMITQAYRDLLERTPEPEGLESWYQSQKTNEQVRAGIKASEEYRRREVTKLAKAFADRGGRLLRVPLIRQANGSSECARAAAVMVLNYGGFEVDMGEDRTIRALPPNAHITNHVVPAIVSLSAGTARAEWFGEKTFSSTSTWPALVASEIDRDRPIIALIPDGKRLGWSFLGHYVVIVGYQPARDGIEGRVAYNDPWDGSIHSRTVAEFAEAWGSASNDALGWQGIKVRSVG